MTKKKLYPNRTWFIHKWYRAENIFLILWFFLQTLFSIVISTYSDLMFTHLPTVFQVFVTFLNLWTEASSCWPLNTIIRTLQHPFQDKYYKFNNAPLDHKLRCISEQAKAGILLLSIDSYMIQYFLKSINFSYDSHAPSKLPSAKHLLVLGLQSIYKFNSCSLQNSLAGCKLIIHRLKLATGIFIPTTTLPIQMNP
jgi:hypothetical protein